MQTAKRFPGHFQLEWFESLEVVSAEQTSATTARVAYRFPVLDVYLNPRAAFHGGAIATFFDMCTSLALFLIAKPGFWQSFGTTRSLNCVYLRPAAPGEALICEAEVSSIAKGRLFFLLVVLLMFLLHLDQIVHAGKRLCLIKGVMKRERDGAVIATCEQNKYNIDAEAKL